jgi:exopolysaccharide biosynthesis protein
MKKVLQQGIMIVTIFTMIWTLSYQPQRVLANENDQGTAPQKTQQNPEPTLLESEWITAGAKLEKWNWKTSAGTTNVNVIEVDLTHPYIQVDAISGKNGQMGNRQSITNMANERGATAAINGDYFTLTAEGAPFGVHVQSGEMIASPGYIDPKYTFALDEQQHPFIGNFDFDAEFIAEDGAAFQIFGINKTQYQAGYRFTGNSHINRLHMYTDKWNIDSWVGDSLNDDYTVALVENGEVTQMLDNKAVDSIPQGAYLLLGHGEAQTFLKEHVHVGDDVEYTFDMSPDKEWWTAVAGTSLLVREGKMINHADPERNARTAVGYSKDNRWMYMVTAEKSTESIGMTFAEMGAFLEKRGAWYAVNLDGGGSTTMATRDLGDFNVSLAMKPKEGSQRSVPNGLGIFSTAPKGSLLDWSIYVPQSVLVNETVTIAVKGYDEYYNPVKPEEIPVEWKGSVPVKEDRSFVIGEPGTYELATTVKGQTEKHVVKTYGRDDIKRLVINQEKIQLHPGGSAQATASFQFTDGTKRTAPNASLTWRLIGVEGTVQPDGTVQAEQGSVGMLVASYEGFNTAIPVIIGSTEYRLIDDFQNAGHYLATGLSDSEKSSFAITDEAGINVGTFTYDFGPSEDIRIAYLNYGTEGKRISGEPSALSIKVKGDKSGHWLRSEFRDAQGNIHRVDLAKNIDWNGWKTLEVPLPQMAYPVTLNSIYVVHLENEKDQTGNAGQLSFAELQVKDWKKLDETTRPSLVFTLNKKEVLVNQGKVSLDQAPVVVDGRTLLPLRHLSELLGGYVEWIKDERKIEVTHNHKIYSFWLDENFMSNNGLRRELDVQPLLRNGRTMLPLRALAESYGFYIEYDAKTQEIRIY